MRMKVKPEGRKDIYIPEKESLKAWIKNKKLKQIHNFIPSNFMMLGADHDVKSILEDIDKADRLAILLNEQKQHNMGHALALITDEKLEMYDIGEVKESDLSFSKEDIDMGNCFIC